MTKTLGTAELLTRPEALLNHLPSKLSEGPVWHPEKGCLIAVLIDRGRVVLVSPTGDLLREFRIGCRVGAAGLCADPSTLILAVEKGWASLNIENGALHFGDEVEAELRTRSNDGKPGPDGAFYFGTNDLEFKDPIASFYRLGPDKKITKLFSGLTLSNGLDWSSKGDKFYHIETFNSWLSEYEFNPETGAVGSRRDLFQMCEGRIPPDGAPDGMCVDAAGNIFIAEWGLHRISVWKPSGNLIGYINVPVARPTSWTFGGKGLQTLYITSERNEGDPSIAGGIFAVELNEFEGRAAFTYAGFNTHSSLSLQARS